MTQERRGKFLLKAIEGGSEWDASNSWEKRIREVCLRGPTNSLLVDNPKLAFKKKCYRDCLSACALMLMDLKF